MDRHTGKVADGRNNGLIKKEDGWADRDRRKDRRTDTQAQVADGRSDGRRQTKGETHRQGGRSDRAKESGLRWTNRDGGHRFVKTVASINNCPMKTLPERNQKDAMLSVRR